MLPSEILTLKSNLAKVAVIQEASLTTLAANRAAHATVAVAQRAANTQTRVSSPELPLR